MDQKLAAVLAFLERSEAQLRRTLHGFANEALSYGMCRTSSLSIHFDKQQQKLLVWCDRCGRKISVNSDGFSIGK